MLARTRIVTSLAVLAIGTSLPATAHAALDVTRDFTSGGLTITATGDLVDTVTIDRDANGGLRIADSNGQVTSSDFTCVADPATLTASCATTTAMPVTLSLGGGADVLDSRAATGITLTVDAGAGADRLRLGGSGFTTLTGTDSLDTIDLAHADSDVRVRYETASSKVVVRCAGCASPWAIKLPTNPKAVLLGTGDDDIDLRTWTVRGLTSWTTGAGRDRVIGSKIRRSVFDTGLDPDVLVSWAPADTLRGGAGTDKIADLGGTGDVLDGGGDIDVMASLDGGRDTMRGGAGRDMCPSLRAQMSTCDSSGRVSGFEMNLYLPVPTQKSVLQVVGIFL